MAEAGAVRRVVLLGGPGAGKSTVGRLLAAELGWQHLDLDREVERLAGRTVAGIFAAEGEAGFRAREAEATARLADRGELVLSPGGGWVTNPALLALVRPGALLVWLRVTPEAALARLAATPGEARPLLATREPLETLRGLLRQREPLYRQAELALDTEGHAPAHLADLIAARVRSGAAPR